VDLRRAQSLIFAVVPFDQFAILVRLGAESSQFTCPRRVLQRTGQYAREIASSKLFPSLRALRSP